MASEQPQPSSEKFTSYEYGIEFLQLLIYSSSCDDGSRAPHEHVVVWGLVSSSRIRTQSA